MKKLACILMCGVLLTSIRPLVSAQSDCNLVLTSDYDSECLLTEYGREQLLHTFGPSEGLVCSGSTVTYTASCDGASSYQWEVTGASGYQVSGSGSSATVVWGSGIGGQVSVTATTASGSACSRSFRVAFISAPQVRALAHPGYSGSARTVRLCEGESVTFTDASDGGMLPLTGFLWQCFNEGTLEASASTANFTFTPAHAGTYTLEHQVQNACGCVSLERYRIEVRASEPLQLSCYGTVTGGRTVTYKIQDPPCSQYNWNVEHGTLEGGQGTSAVTVRWHHAPEGYGVLSLDGSLCQTQCTHLLSKKIPIISNGADIRGPDTVCTGDAVHYQLPLWGSVFYTWSHSGPSGVSVIEAPYPNQYILSFSRPGTYTLNCSYAWLFLGSPGYSTTRRITVKNRLEILSEAEAVCPGELLTLRTNTSQAVRWAAGEHVVTAPTLTVSPTEGENPVITASHSDYCHRADYRVRIRPLPPVLAPENIQGPSSACPGQSVLLRGTPTSPAYALLWEYPSPSNPVQSLFLEGDEVTVPVTFSGSSPFVVKAYQIDRKYGCRSEACEYSIERFSLAAHGLPVLPVSVCPGQTLFFSVPDQSPEVLYRWTIGGDPNRASVVGSPLEKTVSVVTNILPGQTDSYTIPLQLDRTYCGNTQTSRAVAILEANPSPVLTVSPYAATVCSGSGVLFEVQNPPQGTYAWIINGVTYPQGPSYTHTFSTGHPGCEVQLYYRSAEGCVPVVRTLPSVTVLPTPVVSVAPAANPPNSLTAAVANRDERFGEEYLYTWLLDGAPITFPTPDYRLTGCDPQHLSGYCCAVTLLYNGHSCTGQGCYASGRPDCQERQDLEITSESLYCNVKKIRCRSVQPENTLQWSTSAAGADLVGNGAEITVTFPYTGIYSVTLTETRPDGSCIRHTVRCTVSYVPKFKLEYVCTGKIRISDLSLYAATDVYPFPITVYNSAGEAVCVLRSAGASETFPIPPVSAATVLEFRYTPALPAQPCDNELPPLTVYPSGTITAFHVPDNVCTEAPFTVSAEGLHIQEYRWDFGDGSQQQVPTVDHTYKNEMNNSYIITPTLTATDANRCTLTRSQRVNVHRNELFVSVSQLTLPEPCPGQRCELAAGNHNPAYTYEWFSGRLPGTAGSTPNVYRVPETGVYKVRITDGNRCMRESTGNAKFKTAPTARIMGNTRYCADETVQLSGHTGGSSTYTWSCTPAPGGNPPLGLSQLTLSSTVPGTSYTTVLTVRNGEGCSAHTSHSFSIAPRPTAPTLAVSGSDCLTQPPVTVASSSGQRLYWSNGDYGTQAHYFNPGYLTAYYTLQGCPSDKARLYVNPVPDYDAVPTGCYEICHNEFPLPLYLQKFYPNGLNASWSWLQDETPIHSGGVNNPQLPVPDAGTYRLKTKHPTRCHSESPELVLETYSCSSPSTYIFTHGKPSLSCVMENCRLYVTVSFTVMYTGPGTGVIRSVRTSDLHTVISHTPLPVHLQLYESTPISVTLQINDFSTSEGTIVLSNGNDDFVISLYDLGWEGCLSKCDRTARGSLIYQESLSTRGQTAYFQFNVTVPGAVSILGYASDPPQIIDAEVSGNQVSGLLMLSAGKLAQLLDADPNTEFVLDIIVCLSDGTLCKMLYRIPIAAINEMTERRTNTASGDKGKKAPQKQEAAAAISPYLVPNPAGKSVRVEGIAENEIAQIRLLDLQGKILRVPLTGTTLSLSEITKGIYMVRITTIQQEVYYLKLVKQ